MPDTGSWLEPGLGGRRRNMFLIAYEVIVIAGSTRCSVPLYTGG